MIKKYSDPHRFCRSSCPRNSTAKRPTSRPSRNGETVNRASALWTRPRAEVKDEEYQEFYKHVAHDFENPLSWSHNKVEGKLEYTSLLYVPGRAPFDLYHREAPRGLKLYVQRVFIMDQADEFLPLYLRFIKGVVDSNDLSLNVSREILQKDPVIDSMKSALTKRVLDMLEKLAKNEPGAVQDLLEELRPGPQGRPGGRLRQQGEDRRPAALRLHRRRFGRAERSAGRLHRSDEGRPGQDLLPHRRATRR